jgi:predicted cupin superfamily sugar epimerase
MGNDLLKGQPIQFVIPAGVWQAGHLLEGGKYSVYGCIMSPRFTGAIVRLSCSEKETLMPKGFASKIMVKKTAWFRSWFKLTLRG